MMSLEIKKLELQMAQVAVARQANEIKVLELLEAIERIEKDIQGSLAREAQILKQLNEVKGL